MGKGKYRKTVRLKAIVDASMSQEMGICGGDKSHVDGDLGRNVARRNLSWDKIRMQ